MPHVHDDALRLGKSVGLVVADMDGTFLASNKTVPAQNMELLDVLARRGIPFVPCTGRPIRAIPEEVATHRATRYLIGANGSVIADARTHASLRVVSLCKADVLDLYERVRELNVTFDVFADGEVYAERARYEAMADYGISQHTLAMLFRVRKPVDELVPGIVARSTAIEKITCFWKDERDLLELRRAVEAIPSLSGAQGDPKDLELQAAGVSKGDALRWLCDYAQVPVAASVAFGDEGNDVSLLEAAGDGVAMANASDAVKAAADHLTCSNDDAGVAAYLLR